MKTRVFLSFLMKKCVFFQYLFGIFFFAIIIAQVTRLGPNRLVVVVRDITERVARHKAEKELAVQSAARESLRQRIFLYLFCIFLFSDDTRTFAPSD